MQDDAETLKLLIIRGADVQKRLKQGTTCLHAAVRAQSKACIYALLSHGADPAAQDDDGMSSIDLAERLAYPEVLAQLVGRSVQSHVESAILASEQRLQVCDCSSHVCWLQKWRP